MYKIHITKEAKEDISALDRSGDKKSIEKLKKILFELQNNPCEGIGQPEQLKYGYSGYWSRRINKKDRLIYRIYEETVTVTVVSAKGNYSAR
jgi:toxin YoeB